MTAPELKGSIIPGGELAWSSVVTNTGNVPASAFIKMVQPSYEGQPVYELLGNDSWKLVTQSQPDGNGRITQIWGYGGDTLTFIDAGETTGSLMTGIKMVDIDGTAYNSIADLNVSMEGYLVEADAGDNPAEAWGVVGE